MDLLTKPYLILKNKKNKTRDLKFKLDDQLSYLDQTCNYIINPENFKHHLSDSILEILNNLKLRKATTCYRYCHQTIQWHPHGASNYRVNCSDLVNILLKLNHPRAYLAIKSKLSAINLIINRDKVHGKSVNSDLRAIDYAAIFSYNQLWDASLDVYWERIYHPMFLKPGDIVARGNLKKANITGHVWIVIGKPKITQTDPKKIEYLMFHSREGGIQTCYLDIMGDLSRLRPLDGGDGQYILGMGRLKDRCVV